MITWILLAALLGAFGLLVLAGVRIEALLREMQDIEQIDHGKCIAHIASVTSRAFVAERLREYADLWESPTEQPELNRMANELYTPGGPSMPTIWMRQKAMQLENDDG